MKKNQQGFGAIETLLILVIVIMLVGVGYYVFNSQKKTNLALDNATKGQGDSQQLATEANSDTKTADTIDGSTASALLVAGQVDFDIDNRRGQTGVVYIDTYAITDTLSEIWVEYGKDFSTLDQETEHITKEIGLGEAGRYGNFTHVIPTSKLDIGTQYFYRSAAKTRDGKTIYSGISAFTSRK